MRTKLRTFDIFFNPISLFRTILFEKDWTSQASVDNKSRQTPDFFNPQSLSGYMTCRDFYYFLAAAARARMIPMTVGLAGGI